MKCVLVRSSAALDAVMSDFHRSKCTEGLRAEVARSAVANRTTMSHEVDLEALDHSDLFWMRLTT